MSGYGLEWSGTVQAVSSFKSIDVCTKGRMSGRPVFVPGHVILTHREKQ